MFEVTDGNIHVFSCGLAEGGVKNGTGQVNIVLGRRTVSNSDSFGEMDYSNIVAVICFAQTGFLQRFVRG